MSRTLRLALCVLLAHALARAQSPGDLDTSFNPGTGADWRVLGIARQSDGKFVVAGQFNTFNGLPRNRITRLNVDGSTDLSFDPGKGADSTINAVAVAGDGKILVGGDFYSFDGQSWRRLARLTSGGTPDPTFAIGSGADGSVQAVLAQADGKVLLAGGFTAINGIARNRIARLNADGSLDAGFNPGSGANAPVLTLALQDDGKILLGGYFSAVDGVTRHRVARLNSDGSLDTSFVPGTVDNGYVNGISPTSDGKVFVAGGISVGIQSRLIRLLPGGGVDHAFNPGNNAINSDVTSVIAQSDGKVLLAGYFTAINGVSRNGVARMNSDGSLDPAFDPGAGANQLVWTMVLQPDGRLVAGGAFTTYGGVSRNRLTRIHNDGATANQAPQMAAIGSLTILEDSGSRSVTVTGITPGPAGETAQSVTNVTAVSSNPSLIPNPSVTYTPGATTATLAFTPAANANGSVTLSVVAQDNGGTANGGVDRVTNSFTVTVTPVNDAPGFALNSAAIGWITKEPMLNGGVNAAAGGVIDGRWYVAGGGPLGGGTTTQLQTYDPAADAWSLKASAGVSRGAAAAGVIGGKLYVAGGAINLDYNTPTLALEIYDPALDSWSSGAAMSVPRAGATAAVIGGKLYVAGGQGSHPYNAVSALEIYDPVANQWTVGASLPTAVGQAVGAAINGKFYVAGGTTGPANVAVLQIYDPVNNTWTAGAPMSGPRGYASGGVIDGKLFVVGGVDASSTLISTVEIYDPVLDTWTTGTPETLPRTFAVATVINAKLHVAGGNQSSSPIATLKVYTPSLNVAEDSGAYSQANFATSISPGPTDESGQAVDFLVSNDNNGLFSSQPAIGANGTLTFTPAPNANGSAAVTVRAHDDGRTANGGVDTSAPQTFTITVTPVPDAPVLAAIGVSGREDATLAFTAANFTGAYSDAEGTPLASITVLTLPASGTLKLSGTDVTPGQVIPAADLGNLTYVPAANEDGAKTFTVTASDGSLSSAIATVTMTLAEVNDPPSFTLNLGATLLGWGRNDYGQTVAPPEAQGGIIAFDAGGTLTLVLKQNGRVLAWGDNTFGQADVPLAAQSGVTAISTHGHHNLALKSDGSVVAWGNNIYGQTNVPPGAASDVTAIAAGLYHSVALKANGSVVAWGRNEYGQTSVPPEAASGVIAIAAGWDHTLALKDNGSVVAWGNATVANVPVDAQSGVIAVASGMYHALALKANGSVVAWGNNDYGQRTVPVPAQSGVIAIAGGGYHSLALKDTGAVVAWGRNTHSATTVPPAAGSGVVAIAAGGDHSLALVEANNLTVAEDAGAQTIPVGIINISPGPANESSQGVNFIVANNSAALFSSPPAFDTAGTLTYTPAPNANGSATVSVYAQDTGGVPNGGDDTSDTQTFTITVTPVNDAPLLAAIGVSGTEDTTLAFTAANFTGAYSDVEGTPLASITVVTLPTSGTLKLSGVDVTVNQVIAAANLASLTYVPAANDNGAKTFTVTASDGSLSSAVATVTMTLTAVNDAPSFVLPARVAPTGPWTVTTIAGLAMNAGSADGTGAAARFNYPHGMAMDIAGTLYVTDNQNHTIRKITPDGVVMTWAGLAGSAGTADGPAAQARFNQPLGVGIDSAGNLYVADSLNHTIRKITPAGVVSTLAGLAGTTGTLDGTGSTARFNYPAGLTLDSAGNLYVTDSQSHTVRKITSDGVVATLAGQPGVAGTTDGLGAAASFNTPLHLATDTSGNVYVADYWNHAVRKIAPDGMVTTLAGLSGTSNAGSADGPAASARFYHPAGVAVDRLGSVYVADHLNYTIRLIAPDGMVSTLAGLPGVSGGADGIGAAARFYRPSGLVVTEAGDLYVADVLNSTIRKLSPAVAASASLRILEDAGAQTVGAFATGISPGPADEATQAVSFTVTSDNTALFALGGQPVIGAAGTLTFTPALNANGSATVTVVAMDNGGLPGVDTSAPQTFTLTVTPVNDAPNFNLSGTNVTVFPGDGGVVARANWATNISAGPANESGQVVTFFTTNSNPVLFVDQPVVLADGTLEFTPEPTASGVVTVGVRAVDNGGTDNGGVNTSGWQTFTITLAPVKIFVSETPTVIAGTTVEVPISLAGIGTEGGASFTVTYDRPRLVFMSVAVEPGSGLSLVWTEPYPDMNKVGIIVTKPAGSSFPAGTNVMVRLTFQAPIGTAPTNTPIGFSSAVVMQQVSDASANVVTPVLYVPGSVTIIAVPPLEGDVAPRNASGNGAVTVSDAVQLTRFVAGWDPITDFTANGEFQRADCAPRGSLGDGRVTLIDLVQTLRYAAGLDPATPAGGPMMQAAALATSSSRLAAGTRVVRVVGGNLFAGRANTVSVQLDAQGNEAGVSLSLGFDPTALTFVSASVGNGASGGSLMVNNAKAAAGRVGLVLVMPAGTGLAAGTRDLVTLTFNVTGTGTTAITVSGDSPVAREIADVSANVLGASFVGGNFNLILPPGLKAAGLERAADGSLRLVVVNTDGSPVMTAQAARYQVYVTSDLGGAWTLLPDALVIENGALKIVDPAASGAGLRLYKLIELSP